MNNELQSSTNDQSAGLFLDSTIPPIKHTLPAVDNHRSDVDVWNLNQLHKANNCNNCKHLLTYHCEIHDYTLPFKEIDCEQWEYRGKKA